MAPSNLQILAQLFEADGAYVPFCRELRAAAQRSPADVERLMMKSAADLIANPDFPTSRRLHVRLQKAALALAILAATQNGPADQQQMLERTLLSLMKAPGSKGMAQHIIASELTYVDQYLHKDVRRAVLKEVRSTGIRPLTPSIADYLEAWLGQDRLEAYKQVVDKPDERNELTAYFVCSSKGGVGKSLTALSLMHFLSRLADTKVAIIDMDPSGPTLQFSLDVRAVSKTHSLLPQGFGEQRKAVWCYETFLDVLNQASRQPFEDSSAEAGVIAKACIFPVQGLENVSAVLLPDSPTFAAATATYWGSDVDRERIIEAISAVFDQLIQQKCRHVVLDCGPGLWGVNGFLLQWVSERFPAHLFVLGSSNASDIGTTLYETLWIGAAGDFRWASKPHFLVNRWSIDKDLFGDMDKWTESFVSIASNASVTGSYDGTTSATQIYSSRMWSYLYLRVLEDVAPLKMLGLQEDEALSHIFCPPSDGAFAFPWEKLSGSKWYKEIVRSVFSPLVNPP